MTLPVATPATKRRWFRFGLATLFVVVTVAFTFAAFELDWIRQRRDARDWLRAQKDSWYAPSLVGARTQANAPRGLSLFGEKGVVGIGIDVEEFSRPVPYSRAQLEQLFPEARVDISRDGLWVVNP